MPRSACARTSSCWAVAHRSTTLFYGADYPGEVGYGTFFDLNDAQGAFGASNLSPKPEAMAFATMTRALDGTNTLGRVNGTPSGHVCVRVPATRQRQGRDGCVGAQQCAMADEQWRV